MHWLVKYMNKKLIIANWKCNPATLKEAEHLFNALMGLKIKNTEVILCPPFVYLKDGFLKEGPWQFGAQDCHWENKGAFTGAVSPLMLKDLGCNYVIIGHSERRKYFKETDEMINLKIKAALKNRLIPVLCVGEESRESGEEIDKIVGEELEKDLADIPGTRIQEIVIAYEPIWAIGSGNPCSPEDTMKATLFIRSKIAKMYNRKIADKIRVIYGGSVVSNNVASYLKEMGIDGVLPGAASLNATEFINLVKNAEDL